jgi:hypothetical protein
MNAPKTGLTRRAFLGSASAGIGSMALASLLNPALAAAPRARVRRVIFLYMSGGPSQFESFDEKPGLAAMNGRPMPESVTSGQPIAQLQGQKLVCLGPQFPFVSCGASGQRISSLFPRIGSIADELCIVRSMHTEQINHDPAHTFMNSGSLVPGRPSMGAWVLYGLGSESASLPGFIVLTSIGGRNPQPVSVRQWSAGFLPGHTQGVAFQSVGDPVLYLSRPEGVDAARQRDVVEAAGRLDRAADRTLEDPEISTRLRQYEMAFRMQASVPELMDISDESRETLELYGVSGPDGSFAYNCLLARRLAERGVRFIQLYHRGWDHHDGLRGYMQQCAGLCDGPSAALVTDLKRRGMLDDTLVIWSGEFGRTPMAQTDKGDVGRDHHIRCFSLWMAGGGVRGGLTWGASDELGYHAAENPVHVHDLHATMLHLLGVDHTKLTFRFQGRDFRLTDVHGRVVTEILS